MYTTIIIKLLKMKLHDVDESHYYVFGPHFAHGPQIFLFSALPAALHLQCALIYLSKYLIFAKFLFWFFFTIGLCSVFIMFLLSLYALLRMSLLWIFFKYVDLGTIPYYKFKNDLYLCFFYWNSFSIWNLHTHSRPEN